MPLETQISVFLKNKVGSLNQLCTALCDAEINIRGLSTEDEIDWAIIGLIVDDMEKTKKVLGDLELRYGESSVLTFELENRPGALAKITRTLSENNINIVHSFLTAAGKHSLLVLLTTDNKKADQILRNKLPNVTSPSSTTSAQQ